MRVNRGSCEHYTLAAARLFLGGHALVSGSNHFIHYFPEIFPHSPEIAVRFMGVLVDTGMYDLVKVIETLCGFALVFDLFAPLALALEMPVSVIICYLSLFIAPNPRSIYTGPRELLLNIILLLAYWGAFRGVFFAVRPPKSPIWRSTGARKGDAA